ncbi:hypothetical protein E3T43_07295 [Cryobacterium sp. Hh7]|uniref:terminase small subunit n=1 Tax=Cryobacterium sp. Hh7 TaxID=1259159 RepID=UPI00106A9FC4|nr:hypothetical protein [Cryobacterium sp. Hh7]TFD58044.1 hypothetical protein E3T43_07295 [Cryobacterium sp. Hh7]
MDLIAATEMSIEAAGLKPIDAGAVEALRALARKIQAWDVIVEFALDDAAQSESRPSVPQNDNVSISAYLKYCDQLGFTPAGRKALEPKGGPLPAPKVENELERFKREQAEKRQQSA